MKIGRFSVSDEQLLEAARHLADIRGEDWVNISAEEKTQLYGEVLHFIQTKEAVIMAGPYWPCTMEPE